MNGDTDGIRGIGMSTIHHAEYSNFDLSIPSNMEDAIRKIDAQALVTVVSELMDELTDVNDGPTTVDRYTIEWVRDTRDFIKECRANKHDDTWFMRDNHRFLLRLVTVFSEFTVLHHASELKNVVNEDGRPVITRVSLCTGPSNRYDDDESRVCGEYSKDSLVIAGDKGITVSAALGSYLLYAICHNTIGNDTDNDRLIGGCVWEEALNRMSMVTDLAQETQQIVSPAGFLAKVEPMCLVSPGVSLVDWISIGLIGQGRLDGQHIREYMDSQHDNVLARLYFMARPALSDYPKYGNVFITTLMYDCQYPYRIGDSVRPASVIQGIGGRSRSVSTGHGVEKQNTSNDDSMLPMVDCPSDAIPVLISLAAQYAVPIESKYYDATATYYDRSLPFDVPDPHSRFKTRHRMTCIPEVDWDEELEGIHSIIPVAVRKSITREHLGMLAELTNVVNEQMVNNINYGNLLSCLLDDSFHYDPLFVTGGVDQTFMFSGAFTYSPVFVGDGNEPVDFLLMDDNDDMRDDMMIADCMFRAVYVSRVMRHSKYTGPLRLLDIILLLSLTEHAVTERVAMEALRMDMGTDYARDLCHECRVLFDGWRYLRNSGNRDVTYSDVISMLSSHTDVSRNVNTAIQECADVAVDCVVQATLMDVDPWVCDYPVDFMRETLKMDVQSRYHDACSTFTHNGITVG